MEPLRKTNAMKSIKNVKVFEPEDMNEENQLKIAMWVIKKLGSAEAANAAVKELRKK